MQYNFIVNDEKRPDINPVIFGHEDCPENHSHGPAVRPHWLIHYIQDGKGIFRINDKEYSLSKNDMFIIPPNVETFYQADKNEPWKYIWIGFSVAGKLPTALPDTLKIPEAEPIFTDMKKCIAFKNGRSAYLCARIWDLFALISDKEDSSIDYVDNALDCIHTEYMTNLTVEKIAARLNIDRTYFSTLFKEKTGISPKKYLTRHRMHTAAALLRNNSLSVSTIASYVGYSDVFTFSKRFKEYFGVSPSGYIVNYL